MTKKSNYMFRKFFANILNIIYGNTCLLCRKRTPLLCTHCIATLTENKFVTENATFSLFNYRDERVRKIIWYIKYKHSPSLLKILAPLLCLYMDTKLPKGKYILIPVPSRIVSKQKRGYVPTELLARELHVCNAQYIPIEKDKVFFKRETKRQAIIRDRSERISNMRDAFLVKDGVVVGKNCIIIDDIITTGATTSALREALLKSGASSVSIFTLAH